MKLKVTLKRSKIGQLDGHKKTVKAMGLKKVNTTVEHDDNPVIRGMINKVRHLVEVEEVCEG